MKNIIDVCDSSLIKKRNIISYTYFKNISDSLLNYIYKNNNKPRIIGVDGTYIPLSIELKKYGFRATKKNTYCIGLISSLFDVNEKILINYELCKTRNERNGLMNQLTYLREGDTLIMDRGYFSNDLLFCLDEMKIKVIFRMKINNLMVKELIRKQQQNMCTTIFHNNKSIKFRIMTYTINNNDYFLGTTIMNHTVIFFKNLYWKRWSIEIHFRESKYLLSLKNILSRNENKIKQDIYIHHILFLFHSFFKNNLKKMLPPCKNINSTNLFYLIMNNVIYLIFYKNLSVYTKEEFEKIYMALLKNPTLIDPNRHYKRIRIKPIGRWYYCNDYENKK